MWTVERGVRQTLDYMARCRAEEGHLVVIDRRREGRRSGEGAQEDRVPAAEAGADERRQDGRKVLVWSL